MGFYDDYKLSTKLGKGAYGSVYKVKNKQDHKYYAAKFINIRKIEERKLSKIKSPSKSTIEKTKKNIRNSLIQETIILKMIKDVPNIVKYYKYYENVKHKNEENFVIITEIIDGYELEDLFDCLCEGKPSSIPPYVLLKFMITMLGVLQTLHSKNIVHRDIKLANIIFNKTDLKLVDFGFGCMIDSQDIIIKCKPNKAGTPRYISPEVLGKKYKDDINIYKSSDVWALGVTFYALANKKYPYDGKEEGILSGEQYVPSSYKCKDKKACALINNIIELCLERDCNKRKTAEELRNLILQNNSSPVSDIKKIPIDEIRIPQKCPISQKMACEIQHADRKIDIPYFKLVENCLNLGYDISDLIDADKPDDKDTNRLLCDLLNINKPSKDWFSKQQAYIEEAQDTKFTRGNPRGIDIMMSYIGEDYVYMNADMRASDYDGVYDKGQQFILESPATTEDFIVYKGFVDFPFKEGKNISKGFGSSSLLLSTAYSWGKGCNILQLFIPKGSRVLAFTGGCPLEAEIIYPHDSIIFIEKTEKRNYWRIDGYLKKCKVTSVNMHYGILMN